MADPQNPLDTPPQARGLVSAIAAYEKKMEEAKRDLMAVSATLRLFELNGERNNFCRILILVGSGNEARLSLFAVKPCTRKGR